MYGIFTYIYQEAIHVGKYTMHGSYLSMRL